MASWHRRKLELDQNSRETIEFKKRPGKNALEPEYAKVAMETMKYGHFFLYAMVYDKIDKGNKDSVPGINDHVGW